MNKNDDITWGKKMIKVSIHFWTDKLPKSADRKTAWAAGTLHLAGNDQRGFKHDHVIFNDLKAELFPKLQQLLDKNGIKLVKQPAKTEIVRLDV